MNWIKYTNKWDNLKEGTIARTSDGEFVIVGKINESLGINDEFVAEITHYTEDCQNQLLVILAKAKLDFEDRKTSGEIHV